MRVPYLMRGPGGKGYDGEHGEGHEDVDGSLGALRQVEAVDRNVDRMVPWNQDSWSGNLPWQLKEVAFCVLRT